MADPNALLLKIRSQDRGEYDESVHEDMDRWTKNIEDLQAIKAVSESTVIKTMIQRFTDAIQTIEGDLKTKKSMELPDSRRDNMIDQANLYRSFIATFDTDSQLEEIARSIENQFS